MADLRLGSLNKVFLMGRLTRDPELRYAPSGAAVCNFRIAVSRNYRDKDDKWKEEVCYVTVVVWREQGERCGNLLRKGSAVLIEGRLQSRSWETQEGQQRNVLEVVANRVQFLDKLGADTEVLTAESESISQDTQVESDLEDIPF